MKTLKRLLAGAVMAVAGAAVGVLAVRVMPFDELVGMHLKGKGWAAFPVVLFAAWLSIALHELGHVVAGISQGFRFLFFTAGPVWVEQVHGTLRVRFNRIPATWGGLAVCAPTTGDGMARRMAVMALGGPATSLALTVLAAGALAVVPLTSPGTALVRLGAMLLALTSLGIFLATAFMPSIGGGFPSDGERARGLLRGDEAARAESALLSLNALVFAGVRPRDWPGALVTAASSGQRRPMMKAQAELIAAAVAGDTGDDAAELAHTEAFLAMEEDIPSFARSAYRVAAVPVLARRGEVARARALLDATKPSPLIDAYAVSLARAEVELSEGRRDAAVASAKEGLSQLGRARFPPGEVPREQLFAVLDRAALPTSSAA